MPFNDRTEAGHRLAALLAQRAWYWPTTVLATSPGAAVIAFETAHLLRAELDLLQVRPFTAPGRPDRELGAVATGGIRVIHGKVRDDLGVSDAQIDALTGRLADEIRVSEEGWRLRHPRTELAGHLVLIVGDSFGPDARMDVAVMVARVMGARRVVAAAPVGLHTTVAQVRADADEVVCLTEVADAAALDAAYTDGAVPDDAALRGLLERAEEWRAPVLVG